MNSKRPRRLMQGDLGGAFLPRMCVEQEVEQKLLHEVHVMEMHLNRNIFLVYPTRRALSHAAKAFLELVGQLLMGPALTR